MVRKRLPVILFLCTLISWLTTDAVAAEEKRLRVWDAPNWDSLANEHELAQGTGELLVSVAELTRQAERGHPVAQFWLAKRYYEGRHGLTKNKLIAYKWALIASRNGNKAAAYLARELALLMTPTQVAGASAAAEAFKPRMR